MKALRLTATIDDRVLVPFRSLLYPREEKAYFEGRRFGGLPFNQSPHYRTCRQINRGDPIESLPYYLWTLEKIDRLGRPFEEFLFTRGKGCGLDPSLREEILALDRDARRVALAKGATMAYIELCSSVDDSWQPEASDKPMIFLQLLGGRHTLHEGRHRTAILLHHFADSGFEAFETDRSLVRTDKYRTRIRKFLGI